MESKAKQQMLTLGEKDKDKIANSKSVFVHQFPPASFVMFAGEMSVSRSFTRSYNTSIGLRRPHAALPNSAA